MDGIAKGKHQEEIGVREIVEDVDALRLSLGFDRVKVLTPKVETRLRSATLANIPLKLVGEINPTCLVELTFPHGYPRKPIEARILTEACEETAAINEVMTELLQQFCSQPITIASANENVMDRADDDEEEEEREGEDDDDEEMTLYPRALAAVTFVRSIVNANEQQAAISHTPTTSNSDASIEENAVDTDNPVDVDNPTHPIPINNYTCMICGTFLFNSTHIESHPSPRAKDLERHQKSGGGGKVQSPSSCASIFLSTETLGTFLDGMKLVENQGKFSCPKCNGKIGQWCWTGTLINHVIALEYILYPHNTTLHMP